MIYDSITLKQNTQVTNMTVDSGTAFPAEPGAGEMFFRTDESQMYLYTGTEWMQVTGVVQGSVPKISTVAITDSDFNVLDDTAVDTAGGYIKITGSGFTSGAAVWVNQTAATSVTFVSDSELRAQVPAMSAGTYNLYVVNADASVAIRVNGITYSPIPAWSTSSTLSGIVDESISIQLSAPGATTYSLAAGSTLPAGLTLTSEGLLSGTVTGIVESTVYSFSIVAIDAENQDVPRAFTLTVSVILGDENFKDTVLLLKTAAVEGGTNNSIIDSSVASNHITRVGNAAPSSFSPYELTGWSNYFDGTGDWLTAPNNSVFDMTGGSFTVEAWVNVSGTFALDSGNTRMAAIASYGANTVVGQGWGFVINQTSNTIIFGLPGTGSQMCVCSFTLAQNTWYHVAFVRNGSTNAIYVNGVSQTLTTDTYTGVSSSTGTLRIGAERLFTNYNLEFNGYISNLRIVKGTALYTSNFTPSTTPLTAVSGTSLLTCQSNRFVDNSTNNFTITRNGDAKVTSFSPFKFRDNEYAIANAGGATLLDGSTGYLQTSGTFTFGTGAFTIEAWINPTTISSSIRRPIFSNITINDSLNRQCMVSLEPNGTIMLLTWSTIIIQTTLTVSANTWSHVAATCDGTTYRIFINGILAASGTTLYNFNLAGIGSIGYGGQPGLSLFAGYISNLRVVQGTALYTSNFTPSTTPLTAVAGTSLLTLQDNGFKDNSTNNFTLTPFGNVTPTAQSPFRTIDQRGSVYFDGTGDSLQTATVPALGTSDFTIEFWVYPMATTRQDWFDAYIASPSSRFLIYYDGTSINVYGNPPNSTIITGGAITLNRWMHIAVSRQSNSIRLFINGTQSGSTYTTPQNFSGNVIHLGRDPAGSTFATGYISNIRVVNGTALYTSNFTPSTTPLTAVAGTSLLTCQNNGIRDNSSNAFAITRNGDARPAEFSPFALAQETSYAGSVYFDGSGDSIRIPTNVNFAFGTGDFTIEFWKYTTGSLGLGSVIYEGRGSTGGTVALYIANNGQVYIGGTPFFSADSSITTGTWVHMAISRQGTTLRRFVNGVITASASNSSNLAAPATELRIGTNDATNGTFAGYVSNLRIVKGEALYTSAFTPPSAPVAAVQNTTLLINGGSAPAIYDATGRNSIETIGNADTVMTVKKFAGASMYFDGSGDALKIPHSDNISLGSGDFTMEFWAYFNNVNTQMVLINKGWNTSGAAYASYLIWMENNGTLRFLASSNGASWDIASERVIGTMTAGAWRHIAVTRSGTTFRAFIDGQISSSFTFTSSLALVTNVNQLLYIGGRVNDSMSMNGYLEDVRITKGAARYTENFTPPTAAFRTRSN